MSTLAKEGTVSPANSGAVVQTVSEPAHSTEPAVPGVAAQPVTLEVLSPLPEPEFRRLEQCEIALRSTLRKLIFEAGAALLTIRDEHLYRATHPTFEAYCRDRWGISRSYAWRLVGAAERVKLLPAADDVARPTSEFQVRPFLTLAPEVFPKAWRLVLKQAAGGKVTVKILRSVVRQFTRKKRGRRATRSRPQLTRRIPVGQLICLLHEIRQRAERHQSDEFDAALDKLQFLLCKM
jgi:hypothetical protein